MNPIGTILDLLVNRNNVVIPPGYLLCNGQVINEDEHTELFYELESDTTSTELALPNIQPIIVSDKLMIVKIIKYTSVDTQDDSGIGNGEFITK